MKSIVMPVHEQFSKENELFDEVKETVAKPTEVKKQKRKGITVQEMWNRQRTARSASDMIRRWDLH
jgi:hypothetical protein